MGPDCGPAPASARFLPLVKVFCLNAMLTTVRGMSAIAHHLDGERRKRHKRAMTSAAAIIIGICS
jgi:hypothetical protein